MKGAFLAFAVSGAVLAAFGQVSFKFGASGRHELLQFANPWILLGLLLYFGSTVLWIRALSFVPLTVVYPFSALTFVLVHLLAVTVLNEHTSARAIGGTVLVLAGLFLLATSQTGESP